MFQNNLLAGKRILVTGGGSGLGAAMARRFAELGAELILCGRRLELLEQTAARLRADTGARVLTIRCDIRDGANVDAMMQQIWREAPLDVLVNNAAATFIAQTEHLSFRAADAILAPTLHGAMYCTLAAGQRWIPAEVSIRLAVRNSFEDLTAREVQVLNQLAKGLANKEIADVLAISEHTAKDHLKSILGKLQVADRTEAVTTAIQRGIIHL